MVLPVICSEMSRSVSRSSVVPSPSRIRSRILVVQKVLERKAHHDFVGARALYVAADGEELGPGALGTRERHLLVPVRAVEKNRRSGNERLDVVYRSRHPENTRHRREGRLDARI